MRVFKLTTTTRPAPVFVLRRSTAWAWIVPVRRWPDGSATMRRVSADRVQDATPADLFWWQLTKEGTCNAGR